MASEYKSMEDRIRMDLLYRLRWNLLADLHDTEIAVGPNNEERVVPLFDHFSADEDLVVPGLSRIEVTNAECIDKYENSCDRSPEPEGYRPRPLLSLRMKMGGLLH